MHEVDLERSVQRMWWECPIGTGSLSYQDYANLVDVGRVQAVQITDCSNDVAPILSGPVAGVAQAKAKRRRR